MYKAKKTIRERQYFRTTEGRILGKGDLGRWTDVIGGVLIPRFNMNMTLSGQLVLTENTKLNLRNMATVIIAQKPLLLESIPGAGKTFLIDEISKLFGRFDGT